MNKNIFLYFSLLICTSTLIAPPKKTNTTPEAPSAAKELNAAIEWINELKKKHTTNKDEETLARANFECCKKAEEPSQRRHRNPSLAAGVTLLNDNFNKCSLLKEIYDSASNSIKTEYAKGILIPKYKIAFCLNFDKGYETDEIIADSIVELQCNEIGATYYSGKYLYGFYKVEAGKRDSRIFFTINKITENIIIHFAGPKHLAPKKISDKKNQAFMKQHNGCKQAYSK